QDDPGGGGCTADIAELYAASEPTEPGDIVEFDLVSPKTVRKAKNGNNSPLVGIVTTAPAMVMEDSSMQLMSGNNYVHNPMKPGVALAGRVPTKVSTENGPIRVGDPLTASSKPGVAMRATKPGRIIGYALAPFESTYSLSTSEVNSTGKILVFVNPGYWPGDKSFREQLEEHIATVFSRLGLVLENGIATLKGIFVERLGAKVARLNTLEMVDRANGEIWCTWIENGEWKKIKGECE
ncbi:MAG: hypothetical protein ACK4NX_01910, partial [Candidatus Paceibacteria bacterium]